MLISRGRLATYAKHAKVTHAINDITSCHDYKVVNIIQEPSYQPYTSSHVYVWCSEKKLHPYPRVSQRFESIVPLQGRITWQHDTHEPRRQHEWPPLHVVATRVLCIMFTEVEAKRALQQIEQSFCENDNLSRQAHTLRPRREWASSDDLCLWVLVGNPAIIDLDFPLVALIGVAGRRRRKILTCKQNKNNKSQSLSDYAQQDLSITARRPQN
jgi:hypothetical protein